MADVPALNATSDMPAVAPAVEPVVEPQVTLPVTPTPDTTPAPAPVTTDTTPAPAPPPSPITTRIGEIARLRNAAEARHAEAMRANEELRAQMAEAISALRNATSPPQPVSTTPEFVSERPVRETFSDPESYEAALLSWAGARASSAAVAEMKKQQEENERLRTEREQTERETRERTEREAKERADFEVFQTSWNTRRAKAIERYPDFHDVAEKPFEDGGPSIPFGSPMAHMILSREDGPDIAYYLGQHPEESARIAAMVVPGQVFPAGSPFAGQPIWDAGAQAFELGIIAAQLRQNAPAPASVPVNALANPQTSEPPAPVSAPAPAYTQTVTLPPPPPNPISATNTSDTQYTGREPTMAEYAAKREQQLNAARRGRGRMN